jgi:hypothetical protein
MFRSGPSGSDIIVDHATPARRAQLNAATAIFNAIKFRVLDRD